MSDILRSTPSMSTSGEEPFQEESPLMVMVGSSLPGISDTVWVESPGISPESICPTLP